MILTGQLERGRWKNFYDRLAEKIAKSKFSKGNVTEVRNKMMWFSLTLVGTALVWPMKVLEDHKEKWVTKINHTLDKWRGHQLSEQQVAERDAEVDAAIACEHKQTWPTLLIGRVISLATSMFISTVLGDKGTNASKDFFHKWIEKGTFGINKLVGGGPDSKLAKSTQTDGFKYYARLAAPETIGCAATSIALEVSSKFLANRAPKLKDEAFCQAMENGVKPIDYIKNKQKKTFSESVSEDSASKDTQLGL